MTQCRRRPDHAAAFACMALFATTGCDRAYAVSSGSIVASIPPPSAGHALVYHDSLRAVLLVNAGLGGMESPPVDAHTVIWRWSGREWTTIDSSGPPVRNLGGVAYDSRRNAVVLFGGTYDEAHSYDDTWEWRPSSGWRRIDVRGPGRRDHTEMAYDPTLGRTILFGGQSGRDSFPPDTWSWDGAVWQRIAESGPAARVHHSTAYDPTSKKVVVFGGFTPGVAGLGDTWAFANGGWTRAAADVAPRSHARLGATAHGLIVFGGLLRTPDAAILRLVNGVWTPDTLRGTPGVRYLSAMAFDPLRRMTVLFGGGSPSNDALYADTWEYDGTRWRRVP